MTTRPGGENGENRPRNPSRPADRAAGSPDTQRPDPSSPYPSSPYPSSPDPDRPDASGSDPTSTDPTSTDPTSTDPTSTDASSSDASSSDAEGPHPDSREPARSTAKAGAKTAGKAAGSQRAKKSGGPSVTGKPSAAASITEAPAANARPGITPGRVIPRQPRSAAPLAAPSTRDAEDDADAKGARPTSGVRHATPEVSANIPPTNAPPTNAPPTDMPTTGKQPTDRLPTDKLPTDGPAKDKPAQDKLAQDKPGQDKPTQGKPAGDLPAGARQPMDGQPAIVPATRPQPDWHNFAPAEPRQPSRVTRAAVRVGRPLRFLRHEWTLTVLCGLTLSVLINWAALRDPLHTLPQDAFDPSLIAYLIAWDGHALLHYPSDLWQINAFFPSAYGLAYSDALLGYAPFAFVGTGMAAAVLRYNILYILAQALTVIGGYALVRQLGAARIGAAVAAAAFALAPWRLGQAGHLQVLSTGGIVLALAMLARGHGVRWHTWSHRAATERPAVDNPGGGRTTRPGWIIAGWLCATWQITIGFGIGLVFAYVLLGVCLVGVVWWLVRSRRLPSWRLLAADLGGGIVFAGTCLLLARPYLRVLEAYPNVARTDDWIALYSPPLRGLFTAPSSSLLWGDAHAPSRALLSLPGEMALLPGFALYALAAAGLVFSIWRVRVRLALLACVLVTALLGLGTHGPAGGQVGYLWLLHHLPGLDGLRTPGRLIIWMTLCLALLAAGGVAALASRAAEVALRRGLPRPIGVARLALALPLALVLVEGLGNIPHVQVPPAPAAVSTAKPPLLVLPSDELSDMHVMLWSTDRFPDLVNGGSGLVPAEIAETRKQVQQFPDARSVSYLREQGVATVVVLAESARGTPWESVADAPIDDLGITRDITDTAIVFHLAP